MKKVIFGYHEEDSNKTIRFWEYDENEFYSYEIKESNYAIVNTQRGIRLIKVCGYGEVNDDIKVTQNVIKVLDLKEKENESN